ncbi:MAG: hypothetical protein LT070_10785 [Solirubrobacteraceae bacterium]|nr:hypothetical protein [Solirubrobacteraceae bacterium]
MSTSAAARRIDIGGVLGKAFDTYGKYLSTLVLGALVVFVPVALIAALLSSSVFGSLIAAVASIIGTTWYSGMVVRTVQDVQDGRLDSTLGELFSSVTPVLGQLILVGLVAGLGIAIGFVLLIVPGLILLTIWAVAAPVVVVERPGVFAALSRSGALTKGNRWQVFGVIVVIFAVVIAVGIVFGAISAIGDSVVLSFLVQLAMNVLIAPIWALAAAILYFALREAQGEQALPGSMEVFAGGAGGGGFTPPAPPDSAPPAPGPPAAWSPPDAPSAPSTPEAPSSPSAPASSPAPAPAPPEAPSSPSAPEAPSAPAQPEAPPPGPPPASGADAFGSPLPPPPPGGRRPGGSVPPPGMD